MPKTTPKKATITKRELREGIVWMPEGLFIKASLVGKWEAANVDFDPEKGILTINRKSIEQIVKDTDHEPRSRKPKRPVRR